MQLARHRRIVEPAQGGGDIGQQRGGDQIADHQAEPAGDQREAQELGQQQADQVAVGQAERAQGAEEAAALLEGQPDGAMHDEEPHGEGQQAKGGEVEVEAVGQPGGVGGALGLAQVKTGHQ